MSVPLMVESLEKRYEELIAVSNVSFNIQPGEIFGLLGPNGAGKTSIISCVVTLEKPTRGHIEVFGRDIGREPEAVKCTLGVVPQELVHHGFFNVREILEIHSGYYGLINNKERINYLLDKLGLWKHKEKKVRQLSGGMKRRLLVAKALVHSPKLLLLDEPTAGVDIELRESLWNFVCELQKEGLSILLTTHYLEEAEVLCNRVGILNLGQLIKVGNTKDLIKELTHRQVSFEKGGKLQSYDIPYSKSVADLFAELNLELRDVSQLSIKEGTLEAAFKLILGEKKNEV